MAIYKYSVLRGCVIFSNQSEKNDRAGDALIDEFLLRCDICCKHIPVRNIKTCRELVRGIYLLHHLLLPNNNFNLRRIKIYKQIPVSLYMNASQFHPQAGSCFLQELSK